MAASNDRMVSNGRSARDRVGFDQSGSAVMRMQGLVKDRRGQVEIWNAGNHVAEDKGNGEL